AIVRIDLISGQLIARLVAFPGDGARTWTGPILAEGEPLAVDVALHTGAGPGGFMVRRPGGAWSSMANESARGAERMQWPDQWIAGCDPDVGTAPTRFGQQIQVVLAIARSHGAMAWSEP